jgi:hypothetical protein
MGSLNPFKALKKVVKAVVNVGKKIVKGVGKVFSKVMEKLPAIVKVAVIAVAAYFTAGVALSYMGGSAFVAGSMPGFVSMSGVAGGGVFSGVAGSLGVGSGIAAGASSITGATITTGMLGNSAAILGAQSATAGITNVAGSLVAAPAAQGAAPSLAGTELTAAGAAPTEGALASTTSNIGTGAAGTEGTGSAAMSKVGTDAATKTVADAGAAAAGKMTSFEKLMIATTGSQALSGLLTKVPDPKDDYAYEQVQGVYGFDKYGQPVSSTPPMEFAEKPGAPEMEYKTGGYAERLPGVSNDIVPPKSNNRFAKVK